MKYKLINLQTKEEHLCDKITIDRFDYYVPSKLLSEYIDSKRNTIDSYSYLDVQNSFKAGYNKSQETHPFSEEDVREIFKIAQMQKNYGDYKPYTFEEAIQLWKEQKPKIVYYDK